jgi:glyoxylase-like metal-dependent hydrolase (beta-lactamase superfamily II)
VAVFLVRGDDGWTLIDAGLEKHADLIMKAVLDCTKREVSKRLILTHGHPDHAGSALRLRTEWRLKVAAGRREIPYLTEPVFYRKIPAHTPLHYLATLLAQPQMLGRGVDLPLDDKQVIAGMTVYDAPGHAPGMVALLHHADRALLCADVFANRGRLGDPMPFFTYDPKLNRKSQAKLALLDFDHLLPSHGPAIMQSGKQAALAYVEKRVGKRALEAMRPALAK